MEDRLSLDDLRRVVAARGPHDSPLSKLAAAAALAGELRELTDDLVDELVRACRNEGRSWAEIGDAFGITKQAAQQRFVSRPAPSLGPLAAFTERARQAMVYAQEEARSLGHQYLGTEHVLLGMLRERECLAARALDSLGVSSDAVRDRVVELIGRGAALPDDSLRMTPRTKKILELARREAKRLRHPCAGTEHMLLAIVAEGEGVAARVLNDLGADADGVRERLAAVLSIDAAELVPRSRRRRLLRT